MFASQRAIRTMRPGFFTRTFATTPAVRSAWTPGPSPPRLPKEEQELFEQLQKQSTGAFSTPRPLESPPTSAEAAEASADSSAAAAQLSSSSASDMLEQLRARARIAAKGDGEELHPNVRRGAPDEFVGDTNPKTGEVGGPKTEPMRWGAESDWSYNGRVTDF